MIVESEKNAIFGALAFSEYTWLAVGSSQDIGKVWKVRDILAKYHSVVFVPDSDALQDWRHKVEKINLPNASVSDLCAGHAGGWDLADMVRDLYLQHPQTFTSTITERQTKCKIVCISPFLEGYDYMATYNNYTLPPDFFGQRRGAAPF